MSKGLLNDAVMRKITVAEAKQIERQLRAKPDDLFARFDVINFYWQNQWLGKHAKRYQEIHAKHVLWMIRNAPESAGPYWSEFCIDKLTQPVGYGKAKRAWLTQVRKQPQNVEVLWNAAIFFSAYSRKIALGIAKQGAELEPQNTAWLKRLGQIYELGGWKRSPGQIKQDTKRSLAAYEAAMKISGSEADEALAIDLAQAAYKAGEFERAENCAQSLVRWKSDHETDPDGSDALHNGNTLLGRLALRTGDVASAKRYLLASGDVAGSPVLGSFGPSMSLAKELLELGEQEVVLRYFDLCAKFWEHDTEDLNAWTKAVKRGKILDFFQNLD